MMNIEMSYHRVNTQKREQLQPKSCFYIMFKPNPSFHPNGWKKLQQISIYWYAYFFHHFLFLRIFLYLCFNGKLFLWNNFTVLAFTRYDLWYLLVNIRSCSSEKLRCKIGIKRDIEQFVRLISLDDLKEVLEMAQDEYCECRDNRVEGD